MENRHGQRFGRIGLLRRRPYSYSDAHSYSDPDGHAHAYSQRDAHA
jgi:hypothetical protein